MRDPPKSTEMTTEKHVYKSMCHRTLVYHIGRARASSTHGEQGTGAIGAKEKSYNSNNRSNTSNGEFEKPSGLRSDWIAEKSEE